jgi:hypothetical protein
MKATAHNTPDKDARHLYIWNSLHGTHIIAPKERGTNVIAASTGRVVS